MNITVYYCNKGTDTVKTVKLAKLAKNAVKATLEYMNFPCDAELSLTFCGDEYIREINKKYRNIDKPTDVLSFPLNDFRSGADEPEDPTELGDTVINLKRAEEQAEEYGHSVEREVSFLAVHSTLHLLGLDHEISKEEDDFVCELQDKILEELGQNR